MIQYTSPITAYLDQVYSANVNVDDLTKKWCLTHVRLNIIVGSQIYDIRTLFPIDRAHRHHATYIRISVNQTLKTDSKGGMWKLTCFRLYSATPVSILIPSGYLCFNHVVVQWFDELLRYWICFPREEQIIDQVAPLWGVVGWLMHTHINIGDTKMRRR